MQRLFGPGDVPRGPGIYLGILHVVVGSLLQPIWNFVRIIFDKSTKVIEALQEEQRDQFGFSHKLLSMV